MPGNEPKSYKVEDVDAIPASAKALVDSVCPPSALKSNYEKSKLIVHFLSSRHKRGKPIHKTFELTLKSIQRNEGVCSDYVKVFNGLANAANIPFRRWGISFDSYLGWGHAFGEIYDNILQKWIMVDPFNACYVRRKSDDMPLSAMQFRAYMLSHSDTSRLYLEKIDPNGLQFPDDSSYFHYYGDGIQRMIMMSGNNVFSFENHFASRWVIGKSQSLAQTIGIVLHIYPRALIVRRDMEPVAYDVLMQEKRFTLIFLIFVSIWICFGILLFFTKMKRRHSDISKTAKVIRAPSIKI